MGICIILVIVWSIYSCRDQDDLYIDIKKDIYW